MADTTIYFSDGTTCQTNGISLVKKGVQIVKTNGKILRPADYYLYRPSLGMWTEHVDAASVIVAAAKEDYVQLLLGEYIPDERFKEIVRHAQE